MAFRGTFDHSLDAKNRVTIPAKLRAQFADGVVVAPRPDGCVALWKPGEYDHQIEAALSGHNPLSPETVKIKRALHGNSFETDLDAAGRVMIPPKLIELGGLGKDVLILGAGECLELWDPETKTAYDADPANSISELSAHLGHPA